MMHAAFECFLLVSNTVFGGLGPILPDCVLNCPVFFESLGTRDSH
jgi:hypothetical protein